MTILIGIALNQAGYSQTNVLDGVYIKGDSEIVKYIDEIRAETLSKINSYQKSYEKEVVDNDSVGFQYVFKQDKKLKLVTLVVMDGDVEKRVSWYYDQGQLVFTDQIWINNVTNEITSHQKCYEDNGHLIAMINTDNQPIAATSDEYKYVDKELGSYGAKLKEQLSK